MTHGDDDGLRVPPAIAPQQIVILPMLRDNEDEALLDYCDVAREGAEGEPASACCSTPSRARRPRSAGTGSQGAPLILEIGPRDAAGGKVTFCAATRCATATRSLAFAARARTSWPGRRRCSRKSRRGSFAEAKERLDANIVPHRRFDELAEYFGAKRTRRRFPGLGRVAWSSPTGRAGRGRRTVEGAQAHLPQRPARPEPARARACSPGSRRGIRAGRASLLGWRLQGESVARAPEMSGSPFPRKYSGPMVPVALPRTSEGSGDDSGGCVASRFGDGPGESRPDTRLGKWARNTGHCRDDERRTAAQRDLASSLTAPNGTRPFSAYEWMLAGATCGPAARSFIYLLPASRSPASCSASPRSSSSWRG